MAAKTKARTMGAHAKLTLKDALGKGQKGKYPRPPARGTSVDFIQLQLRQINRKCDELRRQADAIQNLNKLRIDALHEQYHRIEKAQKAMLERDLAFTKILKDMLALIDARLPEPPGPAVTLGLTLGNETEQPRGKTK